MAPAPLVNMDVIRENRHRLFERAVQVFADEDAAAQWISAPHPDLDELPPLALVRNEREMERVFKILNRIEFGIYA